MGVRADALFTDQEHETLSYWLAQKLNNGKKGIFLINNKTILITFTLFD